MKYFGQYFDEETGTYYLRARYYDPSMMRFVSEDTYSGENGDPLSLNRYLYVSGNPVMFMDPSGHNPEDAKKGYDFMKLIYKEFPGFVKNTEAFLTTYGNRIPDFINAKVIGEIKNVKYQYLSSQIKGFLEVAREENKKFVLVVEEGTKLSKKLVSTIKRAGGNIIKVSQVTGAVTAQFTVDFFVGPKELLDFIDQYVKDFIEYQADPSKVPLL